MSALVDALWADDPPAEPANALQSLVSRLRRALQQRRRPSQQVPGGYRLLDRRRRPRPAPVHPAGPRRAASCCAPARAPRPRRTLREALALWRGDAFDAAIERDPALLARLQEQHLDALADRIEADLALGRAAELIVELDQLVAAHPLRERLTLLLHAGAGGVRAGCPRRWPPTSGRGRRSPTSSASIRRPACRRRTWPCCAASRSPRRRSRAARSPARARRAASTGRVAQQPARAARPASSAARRTCGGSASCSARAGWSPSSDPAAPARRGWRSRPVGAAGRDRRPTGCGWPSSRRSPIRPTCRRSCSARWACATPP